MIQFQGDIMFQVIDEIPATAVEQKAQGKKHIVAHSETGHHHTVDAEGVVFYEGGSDPLTCYLYAECPMEIIHERPWDTHAPVTLPPGKYLGKRQRESAPEGWRRVAD